jgi:NADH-quinone oxidoreductase subunit E
MDSRETLVQAGFSQEADEIIPLLQYYQKIYGYISQENVREIASYLKVSEAKIFGVASFYTQFRFVKPGENVVQICLGTACHVQGGAQLAEEIQSALGVHPGQVTPDGKYEFKQVACMGCCAQAPLVEINGDIHGKMTPAKLRKVLEEYEDA